MSRLKSMGASAPCAHKKKKTLAAPISSRGKTKRTNILKVSGAHIVFVNIDARKIHRIYCGWLRQIPNNRIALMKHVLFALFGAAVFVVSTPAENDPEKKESSAASE